MAQSICHGGYANGALVTGTIMTLRRTHNPNKANTAQAVAKHARFAFADDVTILIGDVREVLPEIPDSTVQCVVTSPPYFGLRDYGTATWQGGDAECDHKGPSKPTQNGFNERYFGKESGKDNQGDLRTFYRDACARCGAVRIDKQIGMEATVSEYVSTLVSIFREVRRVLRDDGTLWLNLGDSYGTGGSGQNFYDPHHVRPGGGRVDTIGAMGHRKSSAVRGMHKQLLGMPWRVALALQEDGWYLRYDVIWSKPNPMPESVRDRPTRSHEYIFMLTKNAHYYWDGDAAKEKQSDNGSKRAQYRRIGHNKDIYGDGVTNLRNPKTDEKSRLRELESGTRNMRGVWTMASFPYTDAHFATFPPELPRRCIEVSTAPGDAVLDPFGGSGTTLEAAVALGRKGIAIDLDPDCERMMQERLDALRNRRK